MQLAALEVASGPAGRRPPSKPSTALPQCLADEQDHGDDIGDQSAARERHDQGHVFTGHGLLVYVHMPGPDQAGGNQLEDGHQAGGQMGCAYVGAVAEFEHGGDEIHHDGGEELAGVMELRPVDVADEKSEIERAGEDDEETEYNFFKIHWG